MTSFDNLVRSEGKNVVVVNESIPSVLDTEISDDGVT